MMFCEIHFHEKIVAYNPTTDELLCAQCLVSSQYSTNKGSYELIEQTFEKMKQNKLKQKKQCSSLLQDLNRKLFEIQKTRSDLRGEIERTHTSITSFFQQVRESIDRQEKNMGEYMKQIVLKQETKLNNQEKVNLQSIKTLQDIQTTIDKFDQNMYITLVNQKKFQVQIEKVSNDIQKELVFAYSIPDIDYSKIFSQILQDSSELFQRLNVQNSGNNSTTLTTDNTSNLKDTNFSMTNTFIITNTQNNLTHELKNLSEDAIQTLSDYQQTSYSNPYSNNNLKENLKSTNQAPKTKVLQRTSSVGNIANNPFLNNNTSNQIYYKSNYNEKLNDYQLQKSGSKVMSNNSSLVNTMIDDKENVKSIEQERTPQQINTNTSSLVTSNIYSTAKKQATPSEKKQINNTSNSKITLQDASKYNSINKLIGESKMTPQYPRLKSILTEQTAKQQQLLNNQISKKINSISSTSSHTGSLFDKIALNYSQLYKHSMSNASSNSSHHYNNTSIGNNINNINYTITPQQSNDDSNNKKKSQRSVSTYENNTLVNYNDSSINNNSSINSISNDSYSSKLRVQRPSIGEVQDKKVTSTNNTKQEENQQQQQQQLQDQQYIKVSDQIKKLYSEKSISTTLNNYQFIPHTQTKGRKNLSANASPSEKKVISPQTSRIPTSRITVQSARTSPKNNSKSPSSSGNTQRSPKTTSRCSKPPTYAQQQNNFFRQNVSPIQQQQSQQNMNNNINLYSKTQVQQPSMFQEKPEQGYRQKHSLSQHHSQSTSSLSTYQRVNNNSNEGYRNQAYQFKNKCVNATKSSRSLSHESLKRTFKDSDLSGHQLNQSGQNQNNNSKNNYSFQALNINNSNNSYNNESLGMTAQKQNQMVMQNLSKREFYDIKQDITIISKDNQYNYEMIFKNKNDKMDVFKPINNQIKQIMNEIEGYNIVQLQEGTFYLFNGMIYSPNRATKKPNNYIYKIDFKNQVIEEKIEYSPSAPRYQGSAVRMKDQILICGGRDTKDVILDNVEILKIRKNQFHNLAITRMTQNRYSFSLAKITNMIYLALGGRSGPKNMATNTCESLAITATQAVWNQFPSMLVSRYAFETAFLNNKLFAIGGIGNDGNVLNSIEFCDLELYLSANNNMLLGDSNQPTLPTWSFVDCKMQIPRHSFGHVIQNNEVIIIGGVSTNTNNSNNVNNVESEISVEVFDSESQQTFYIMNTLYSRKDIFAFTN